MITYGSLFSGIGGIDLGFDRAGVIDVTISNGEIEANHIENKAAERSYDCGFGVSEWEAFLEPEDTARLIELGEKGYGTWGREPATLGRIKRIQST